MEYWWYTQEGLVVNWGKRNYCSDCGGLHYTYIFISPSNPEEWVSNLCSECMMKNHYTFRLNRANNKKEAFEMANACEVIDNL